MPRVSAMQLISPGRQFRQTMNRRMGARIWWLSSCEVHSTVAQIWFVSVPQEPGDGQWLFNALHVFLCFLHGSKGKTPTPPGKQLCLEEACRLSSLLRGNLPPSWDLAALSLGDIGSSFPSLPPTALSTVWGWLGRWAQEQCCLPQPFPHMDQRHLWRCSDHRLIVWEHLCIGRNFRSCLVPHFILQIRKWRPRQGTAICLRSHSTQCWSHHKNPWLDFRCREPSPPTWSHGVMHQAESSDYNSCLLSYSSLPHFKSMFRNMG